MALFHSVGDFMIISIVVEDIPSALQFDRISLFIQMSKLALIFQADATAWMGFFCSIMLEISLILANRDPIYLDMASKFFEHVYNFAG